MSTSVIDEALWFISDSFKKEQAEQERIAFLLNQYPNIESRYAWEIMPLLFWTGVLDSLSLRAMDYWNFLQTAYWAAIVWKIKQRDRWCKLCAGFLGEMHVHHSTYRNRGNEWQYLEDLILLCEDCHKTFHNRQRKG